jgi:hypothetical protein
MKRTCGEWYRKQNSLHSSQAVSPWSPFIEGGSYYIVLTVLNRLPHSLNTLKGKINYYCSQPPLEHINGQLPCVATFLCLRAPNVVTPSLLRGFTRPSSQPLTEILYFPAKCGLVPGVCHNIISTKD